MLTLQELMKNGKPIKFFGIVGKAGPRQTTYGWAIDVADNSVRPCKWVDVIPDDPEVLVKLSRGDSVCVEGVILEDGQRPLVYAKVTALEI